VLRGLFDLLGLQRMVCAQGGLRHGVLYDMLSRDEAGNDLRSNTVQRLVMKFAVDQDQAARVSRVAQSLYRQLMGSTPDKESDRHLRKLAWAAQLHEVGSQISHSDYHKHGAYILDNVDALGFAQHELHRLSQLVLGHHGKLRKLELDFIDNAFIDQLLCLRVAVVLCHARRDPDIRALRLSRGTAKAQAFVLAARNGWPEAYPQSAHLLREEVNAWLKTDWELQLEMG